MGQPRHFGAPKQVRDFDIPGGAEGVGAGDQRIEIRHDPHAHRIRFQEPEHALALGLGGPGKRHQHLAHPLLADEVRQRFKGTHRQAVDNAPVFASVGVYDRHRAIVAIASQKLG